MPVTTATLAISTYVLRRDRRWRMRTLLNGRLETGFRQRLHIREERISTRRDACRLLYVSDIHLRRTRSELLALQVLDAARECQPDAILLGGDLVDQVSELGRLRALIAELSDLSPVLAVGGNHDRQVGLESVREAVVRGGGEWIHDDAVSLRHGARTIEIQGPGASNCSTADLRVLCAHHPSIWRSVRWGDFNLVLAGHLHGCQFVAFEMYNYLFPGAVFYSQCCLRQQQGTARLVVSRGVSDLIPIRWRCPREVVLCHV